MSGRLLATYFARVILTGQHGIERFRRNAIAIFSMNGPFLLYIRRILFSPRIGFYPMLLDFYLDFPHSIFS